MRLLLAGVGVVRTGAGWSPFQNCHKDPGLLAALASKTPLTSLTTLYQAASSIPPWSLSAACDKPPTTRSVT